MKKGEVRPHGSEAESVMGGESIESQTFFARLCSYYYREPCLKLTVEGRESRRGTPGDE